MTWFLGGHRIIKAGWAGPRAVQIDFVSSYHAGWVWQLYAGRQRIGSTLVPAQRRIVGQLIVDDAPAPLTLIRVDIANRLTDYGPELPPVPWHRFRLAWDAAGLPADTNRFVLTASTEPGGEPNPENILAEPPFIGDGSYAFLLPPVPRSGEWTYRITPFDDAQPLGNAGTPTDVVIVAAVPPPDVALQDDGHRFGIAVEDDQLTVSFAYGGTSE